MRLGFDLDGTLADMQTALAREARSLFPEIDPATLPRSTAFAVAPEGNAEGGQNPPADSTGPTPEAPASATHGLSSRQQRDLWRAVCARENFWETLDEIEPGALAQLFAVATKRRWEIIFLTSRPESAGDTAQLQSHRWLAAHGFPAPSIFVVHGSRGKIAAALALDVLVDDRPENCLDISIDSSARAILVWRGGESTVPASARQLGIGSVRSIAECLDVLERLDEPGTEGVIERFKRLLGLKPRASRARGAAKDPAAPTGVATSD
jgi:hypothetical protein